MKTIILLADGFEEVEALTPLDVLRRAGVDVDLVSIMEREVVVGAHSVPVMADSLFENIDKDNVGMVIVPGGMPGAAHIDMHEGVGELITRLSNEERPLAAICAGPMVFGRRGLLKGRRATCYPGFEKYLEGAEYTSRLVERDGNFITGKGPGAAMDFAFEILTLLMGADMAAEVKKGMIVG